MELTGASALVTGGAGGLGAATVRRLSQAGMHVVIADLAEDRGQELAKEIGDDARFVRTDVTDEESVRTAVDAASELGPLRVSVAAHGGPAARSRVLGRDDEPYPLDLFRQTLEIFLTRTFCVLQQAAAAMARTSKLESGQRGVIINTGEYRRVRGQAGQSDYSAAKGGVVGLGLVAARDLSPLGIRVMTIAPGTFFTPAFRFGRGRGPGEVGNSCPIPSGWAGRDEYGMLVRQIAENDYLNGEVIRIDGAQRFGLR